jgi:hypothetical protein
LTVTGSLAAPNITGSLQGTASWAVSASWAPSSTLSTSFISTGSVSASVSTNTSSLFEVVSGSTSYFKIANNNGTPEWQSTGSVNIRSNGGSIRLATSTSSDKIIFANNNVDYWEISNINGNLNPLFNITTDIASASNRVRDIYLRNLDASGSGRFISDLIASSGPGKIAAYNDAVYIGGGTAGSSLRMLSSGPSNASSIWFYHDNAYAAEIGTNAAVGRLVINPLDNLGLLIAGNEKVRLTNGGRLLINPSGTSLSGNDDGINALQVSGSGRFTGNLVSSGSLIVASGDVSVVTGSTNYLRIFPSTGNTFIGSTPVDSGFKLDINGTTRLQNTLTVSAGGSNIVGNTIITGSLNVSGSSTISGSFTISTTPAIGGWTPGGMRVVNGGVGVDRSTYFYFGDYPMWAGNNPNPQLHLGAWNQSPFLESNTLCIKNNYLLFGANVLGSGFNESRLLIGVNTGSEYSTGGNYPSSSNNYFYINTQIDNPNPSTNTRRPLYIGADSIQFYVSSSNSFNRAPLMTLSGSNEVLVSGSARITDVLTLPYQHPLPSSPATGSIALSGSGATFVGMFVWTGVWTQI